MNPETPTLDSLNALFASFRKRHVVFHHSDDRDAAEEVCRRLREEGHDIAAKRNDVVEPGQLILADADALQPPKFLV